MLLNGTAFAPGASARHARAGTPGRGVAAMGFEWPAAGRGKSRARPLLSFAFALKHSPMGGDRNMLDARARKFKRLTQLNGWSSHIWVEHQDRDLSDLDAACGNGARSFRIGPDRAFRRAEQCPCVEASGVWKPSASPRPRRLPAKLNSVPRNFPRAYWSRGVRHCDAA